MLQHLGRVNGSFPNNFVLNYENLEGAQNLCILNCQFKILIENELSYVSMGCGVATTPCASTWLCPCL